MKNILQFPTEYNGQPIGPDVITKKHTELNVSAKASNTEKAIIYASHLDSYDEETSRVIRRLLKQITTSSNPQEVAQAALNVMRDSRIETLRQTREILSFEKAATRERARSVVVRFPKARKSRVH
jgi:hypothetical protein